MGVGSELDFMGEYLLNAIDNTCADYASSCPVENTPSPLGDCKGTLPVPIANYPRRKDPQLCARPSTSLLPSSPLRLVARSAGVGDWRDVRARCRLLISEWFGATCCGACPMSEQP